mmetsp:Transcript_105025/g.338665  ORF Transcript_105025/g.338665 Transcript_105025/m.338665 type:complete len:298 (+) Transcript_105025:220-1113(+)
MRCSRSLLQGLAGLQPLLLHCSSRRYQRGHALQGPVQLRPRRARGCEHHLQAVPLAEVLHLRRQRPAVLAPGGPEHQQHAEARELRGALVEVLQGHVAEEPHLVIGLAVFALRPATLRHRDLAVRGELHHKDCGGIECLRRSLETRHVVGKPGHGLDPQARPAARVGVLGAPGRRAGRGHLAEEAQREHGGPQHAGFVGLVRRREECRQPPVHPGRGEAHEHEVVAEVDVGLHLRQAREEARGRDRREPGFPLGRRGPAVPLRARAGGPLRRGLQVANHHVAREAQPAASAQLPDVR